MTLGYEPKPQRPRRRHPDLVILLLIVLGVIVLLILIAWLIYWAMGFADPSL
jgi:hypothetical protein